MVADTSVKQDGLTEKVKKYFQELSIEWKKITFPEYRPLPFTKKGWHKAELWRATITVFVFTIIFALILSGLDALMTQIFKAIFR
jgi:preprotein translocase subunit SecE